MAKNLFEQLLSKAGEIWSGPKTYGDYDMYIKEDSKDSSGLSGVAKYLAKQEQAAKPKEEEPIAAPISGVDKYLARQQGSLPKATQETPTTGVGKYLARKASAGAAPLPPKEPVVIPKTGVGKYLAGIPLSTESKTAAPEKKQPQQNKPEASKPSAPAKKTATSTIAKQEAPAPASKISEPEAAAAPAPTSSVIRFENVTQCHASTVKGTQCKNTTNLTKIQRTINKQKYQFCACAQHNNDSFKPYQPLLSH